MAKTAIVYRALAPLIGPDDNLVKLKQRGSVMGLTRRAVLAGGVVAGGRVRRARAEAPIIKVGVLTDLSGPYRDINGPNGIACAKQAVAEFMAANPGIKVEVIATDHQNKPDVGVGILRGWYDNDGVDMVTDLTNSAVALACSAISAEKDRVCMVTAGGSSALTGAPCNANTVHWTYDSWNLAHVTGSAVTKQGGRQLVLRHSEVVGQIRTGR